MRSLLIAGVLGLGGVAFGLSQGFGPFHDQMARAVTALGGDPSKLPGIHVRSLRHTYDDVVARITKLSAPVGAGSAPMKLLDYAPMSRAVDLLSMPGANGPVTDTVPAMALTRQPIDYMQMASGQVRDAEAFRSGLSR